MAVCRWCSTTSLSVYSLFLSSSVSPSNFSLHVSKQDCAAVGRHRKKTKKKNNNNNSGAGINLNALTPLNQPIRFFSAVAWPTQQELVPHPLQAYDISVANIWRARQLFESHQELERRRGRRRYFTRKIGSNVGRGTLDSKGRGGNQRPQTVIQGVLERG